MNLKDEFHYMFQKGSYTGLFQTSDIHTKTVPGMTNEGIR